MTAVYETRSLNAPPHSAEAEESVLGSVLLSSEAANIALEKLQPEDFYIPAHQSIFEAIVALFDNNQPIDAVTVSESLRKLDALDRSGGPSYLAQLLDAVPTASNIEHYTGIVEEHALRRRLQRVGGDVTQLATRMEDDIATVLDRAEQSVFAVSERRIGAPPSNKPKSSTVGAAWSPGCPPASEISTRCLPVSIPPTCSSWRHDRAWAKARWH